jgi:hypothetical protein
VRRRLGRLALHRPGVHARAQALAKGGKDPYLFFTEIALTHNKNLFPTSRIAPKAAEIISTFPKLVVTNSSLMNKLFTYGLNDRNRPLF